MWGALIGAAASLYAGNRASKDARRAGDQAAAGSAEATALQREMWQQQMALMRPQYDASNWALGMLTGSVGGPTSWGNGYTSMQAAPGAAPAGGNALWGRAINAMNGGTGMDGAGQAYLQANPDVAADPYFKLNPMEHYNRHGRGEGRQWGGMQTGGNQPAAQAPMDRSKLYEMFRNAPGYEFGRQEGQKTVEAGAAARGGLNSGATLKALQKYGTDYADAKGWQPYLGTLKDIAGLNNSTQMAQSAQNFGQQVGQNYQNAANARSQSTYASGQARQDAWANAAYFGGQAYDQWRAGR